MQFADFSIKGENKIDWRGESGSERGWFQAE